MWRRGHEISLICIVNACSSSCTISCGLCRIEAAITRRPPQIRTCGFPRIRFLSLFLHQESLPVSNKRTSRVATPWRLPMLPVLLTHSLTRQCHRCSGSMSLWAQCPSGVSTSTNGRPDVTLPSVGRLGLTSPPSPSGMCLTPGTM